MEYENKLFSTANLIKIALLAVIAVILMQFGALKLPALFPSFLELDFSEVPAIMGILMVHPLAGIVIVILKNILRIVLFQTTTAYAGEIANMTISIGYILPLTLLMYKKRDFKRVALGMILGIFTMTALGAVVNYFITLPMYAKLFMPMEAIIEMGHVIYSKIIDKRTLILYSFVPFNLLKGTIVAIIGSVLIKALKPMIVHLGYKVKREKK